MLGGEANKSLPLKFSRRFFLASHSATQEAPTGPCVCCGVLPTPSARSPAFLATHTLAHCMHATAKVGHHQQCHAPERHAARPVMPTREGVGNVRHPATTPFQIQGLYVEIRSKKKKRTYNTADGNPSEI